jgi:superfamily II DNA helicase RecQ
MGGDEIRPDFKKVGELTCIFESAAHLALTVNLVKELENVLNYNNPDIVWANPDRSTSDGYQISSLE